MLKIYKSNLNGILLETNTIEHNALIYMIDPSEDEIETTANTIGAPIDFFRDSLDKNERPRVEKADDALLIVLNLPITNRNDPSSNGVPYLTLPIGIIHGKNHLVIVAREEITLVDHLLEGQYGDFQSYMKTRITLLLFKAIADAYDNQLIHITERVTTLQKALKLAYRNQELFGLINLNKSLVYFSTSLSAMTILYRRLMLGNDFKLYEEDRRWLNDALIDLEQSAEVTEIRRESLSNLMDAYAAIIHNNLNSVLKLLTTLAIVMVIPTMIGSIFSMNVALPYEEEWISTIVIGIAIVAITALLLRLFHKRGYLRL